MVNAIDVGNASTAACLRIETDGTAVYYSRRQEPTGDAACDLHYYVMRHSSDVVVETLDDVGYHYVVTRTGENHVGVYRVGSYPVYS